MTEVAFFLFIAPLNPVRGLRRVAPPHRQGNWAAHPYKPVYSPSPFMERGGPIGRGSGQGEGRDDKRRQMRITFLYRITADNAKKH